MLKIPKRWRCQRLIKMFIINEIERMKLMKVEL